MKKFLFSVIFAVMFLVAAPVKADNVASQIALWPVNRVLDALDVFSVSVMLGPTVRAELMATEYCKGGAGIGYSAGLFKGYNRQYGMVWQNGWYWALVVAQNESFEQGPLFGTPKAYQQNFLGVPSPYDEVYDFYLGERDFWRIGGALGLIVQADLYLHPVEIADFVTGIFFIDLRADDLRGDDFTF